MSLTGLAFLRAKAAHQGKIVWSIINKDDFAQYKGKQEDVDSVADDLLMTTGSKVSIFFREIDNNMLRVSLRSKGDIDVGYLATTYGGGGHDRVSSCRIHKTRTGIEHLIKQAALLIEKRKVSGK